MPSYPHNAAIRVSRFSLHDMTNCKGSRLEPHEMNAALEDECLYNLHWYCRGNDFEILASAPIEQDPKGKPGGFVYLVHVLGLTERPEHTEVIKQWRQRERDFYGLD